MIRINSGYADALRASMKPHEKDASCKKPCKDCPFKRIGGIGRDPMNLGLNKTRIANGILQHCHKTVLESRGENSLLCKGIQISLEGGDEEILSGEEFLQLEAEIEDREM